VIDFGNIETKEDVLKVVDNLHSKAMKDCGATKNPSKTSEALVFTEKLLELAHNIRD